MDQDRTENKTVITIIIIISMGFRVISYEQWKIFKEQWFVTIINEVSKKAINDPNIFHRFWKNKRNDKFIIIGKVDRYVTHACTFDIWYTHLYKCSENKCKTRKKNVCKQ